MNGPGMGTEPIDNSLKCYSRSFFDRIPINTCAYGREADRFDVAFLRKAQTGLVTGFQKLGFPVFAVAIARSDRMKHVFCGEAACARNNSLTCFAVAADAICDFS